MQRPGSDVDPAGDLPQTRSGIVRPCQVDQDLVPVPVLLVVVAGQVPTVGDHAGAAAYQSGERQRRRGVLRAVVGTPAPTTGRSTSVGWAEQVELVGHRPGVRRARSRPATAASRKPGMRWAMASSPKVHQGAGRRCSPERAAMRTGRPRACTGPSAGRRPGVPVYAAAKCTDRRRSRHRRRGSWAWGPPEIATIEKSSTP